MKIRLTTLTFALLWVPTFALAWQVELHGDLAMERLSGQSVSALDAGFVAEHGALKVGWNVPIRADLTNTRLRRRDWDERGEWSRLLPTISWKRPTDDGRLTDFQLRLGPTSGATMGHGSIIRDYRSALLVDHFKSALQVDVDAKGVGLQVLIADVTQASLIASRLFFRPRVGAAKAHGLTIGITAAADRKAPVNNRLNAQGTAVSLTSQLPDQDHAPLVIAGIDVSLPFSINEAHHLVPYVDLNVATVSEGGGGGVHAGLWWSYQVADLSL
ncbi:MAG TPA: hypothetical protein DCQ06_01730, partial [Myxococcales bacterium]|nr:hypothetical protein [Myxococcales bacterium]